MTGRIKIALLAGATSALSLGSPALAQSEQPAPSPADTRPGGFDEIVVTAQKRVERLQDVPISVTALSDNQLKQQGVTRVEDLASIVPNLQLNPTVGDGAPVFSLRGVTMTDYSLSQNGPVATYYDEVYKGNFAIMGVAMYDLERVEVLRGPQGTLYGKNTTGGAINLISRKPDFTTGGTVTVGYGNYDRVEASGAVQTSFGEKVAGRLAFTFERADGWFRNQTPGNPDLNDKRQYAIRGTIVTRPTEDFEFTLRASTSLQNPHLYGIFGQPTADGVGGGVYAMFGGQDYFREGLGRRELEVSYTPRRRARTYAVAGTADWTLSDNLALTSVTSYDHGTLRFGEDGDGSPLEVNTNFYFGRAKQFTQDLRLASTGDGPFHFLVGAYYNRESLFNRTALGFYTDLDVNGDGTLTAQDCIDGGGFLACNVENSFNQIKTSYAAYTDLSYDLMEKVILRGGLRYTHDRGTLKNFISQMFGPDGELIANLIPGSTTDLFATTSAHFRKSNVSGKVGIDFKPDRDTLIYLTASRGYRGNSFNAQAFFVPDELSITKPETIDALEVGAKAQLFDRRIQLSGAVFAYNYKNQQYLSNDPDTGVQRLENLPKARIYGAELEVTARPVDNLRLSGGLGLLRTRVRKGMLQGEDLKGNRLSTAPAVSLSGAVDWTVPLAGAGSLLLHVDGSHASSQYSDLLNKPFLRRRALTLLNSRIGFRTEDERTEIAVWIKNITNEYYFNSRLDASGLGFIYNHIGDPRTYGVTLTQNF